MQLSRYWFPAYGPFAGIVNPGPFPVAEKHETSLADAMVWRAVADQMVLGATPFAMLGN